MQQRAIFFLATAALLLSAHTALAQSGVEGFLGGGVGSWSNNRTSGSLVDAGAGVEALPDPRLGIGGEAGLLTSFNGGLVLTFSGNARVRFTNAQDSRTLVPFAGGGYTRLNCFGELSDHAWNYLGGVDYRLSERRAIRFELRDIVRSSNVTSHYLTVRVGLTFR